MTEQTVIVGWCLNPFLNLKPQLMKKCRTDHGSSFHFILEATLIASMVHPRFPVYFRIISLKSTLDSSRAGSGAAADFDGSLRAGMT
jgi:hypothetical protein